MASTVTTQPNHYELLGLKPQATADEITAAFAREIGVFRPRAFGGAAGITVAYETLRDPERRRAYDESIGLKSKPEPKPEPPVLRSHGTGHASFMGALERPAIALRPTPAPPVSEVPRGEPRPAPPRDRPIGEALRHLARPAPLHDPVPAKGDLRPSVTPSPASPATMPSARHGPPPHPAGREELALAPAFEDEMETPGAAPWKRAGLAAGGVALVVALAGAWAGWQSSGAVPTNGSTSAQVPPPPDTNFTVSDLAATAALGPDGTAAAVSPVTQPRISLHRREGRNVAARARPTARLADIERGLAEPTPAEATPTPAAAPAEVDADPVTATTASMPLSNATIARTIRRIGYPCGSVASTSQILGGVFTVTCTSGHVYRAAPVRGRYHFRRVG
jgi:hypothetical protein